MIETQPEQRLVAGVIVLAVMSAVAATTYLWYVYRGVSQGLRSRLYGAIAFSATLVTIGALLVMVPAMLALFDAPRLPSVFNLILLGVGITLALSMPTYMADFVRRLRAARKARAEAIWKRREE